MIKINYRCVCVLVLWSFSSFNHFIVQCTWYAYRIWIIQSNEPFVSIQNKVCCLRFLPCSEYRNQVKRRISLNLLTNWFWRCSLFILHADAHILDVTNHALCLVYSAQSNDNQSKKKIHFPWIAIAITSNDSTLKFFIRFIFGSSLAVDVAIASEFNSLSFPS